MPFTPRAVCLSVCLTHTAQGPSAPNLHCAANPHVFQNRPGPSRLSGSARREAIRPARSACSQGLLGPRVAAALGSRCVITATIQASGPSPAGRGRADTCTLQWSSLFPRAVSREGQAPTACPQPSDCLAFGVGKPIFLSGLSANRLAWPGFRPFLFVSPPEALFFPGSGAA